jgi:hypothetical protein
LLLTAVLATVGLQLAAIYVGPLNHVFKTEPLDAVELAATMGTASIVFIAVEIEKCITRRTSGRAGIGQREPTRVSGGIFSKHRLGGP